MPFCSWQRPWATFQCRRTCTATEEGESRDVNRTVGRAGHSDRLWGSVQQLSDSNQNPHQVQSSSFKPPLSQLTGSRKHYENRHSSLWAQGEPPITLQLTEKKKVILMDAERNHVQPSMTVGWKCHWDSGRVPWHRGQGEPWGRTGEAQRKDPGYCMKGGLGNPPMEGKVEVYVRMQEKQKVGRGCGQRRLMAYPPRSYIKFCFLHPPFLFATKGRSFWLTAKVRYLI